MWKQWERERLEADSKVWSPGYYKNPWHIYRNKEVRGRKFFKRKQKERKNPDELIFIQTRFEMPAKQFEIRAMRYWEETTIKW